MPTELDSLESAVNDRKNEIYLLNTKIEGLREELNIGKSVKSFSEILNSSTEDFRKKKEELQNTVDSLKKQVESLEKEKASVQAQTENLRYEIERLTQDVATTKNTLEDYQLKCQVETNSLKTRIHKALAAEEAAKSRIALAEQSEKELLELKESLLKSKAEADRKYEAALIEISNIESSKKDMEASSIKLDSKLDELKNKEAEILGLVNQLQESKKSFQVAESDHASFEQRKKNAENLYKTAESLMSSAQEKIAESKIREVIARELENDINNRRSLLRQAEEAFAKKAS